MNLFGVLMATFMVYGMEAYNAILRGGLSLAAFVPTIEVLLLIPVVMFVQNVWGGPLAGRLVRLFAGERELAGAAAILARQAATVAVMCPTMSLVAVFVFKGGLQPEFWAVWGNTILCNLPMAAVWQVCVAGPVVRNIVRQPSNSTSSAAS